uniref:Uncharacterized protein n=1 Tax=viral metagenome TaxID=1070528 RepID=A0A6C0H7J4_9ZZZZ
MKKFKMEISILLMTYKCSSYRYYTFFEPFIFYYSTKCQ